MPQAPSAPASLDLVPVNVYVVDRAGRPVTDLKQSDFTVLENGVPQQVRSFALQALEAATAPPDAAPALRKGITLAPQDGRMFVILLGLGRLDEPAGYISGLLRLVKTQLLPQDRVALFAYDRALPFTTDHQKVAEALLAAVPKDIDLKGVYGLEKVPTLPVVDMVEKKAILATTN
jgi:VWFA-related protein